MGFGHDTEDHGDVEVAAGHVGVKVGGLATGNLSSLTEDTLNDVDVLEA